MITSLGSGSVVLRQIAEKAAATRDLVRWDDFRRGQDDSFCRQAGTALQQSARLLTPATLDNGGTNNSTAGVQAGGYADTARKDLDQSAARDQAWSAIATEVGTLEQELAGLTADQCPTPEAFARLQACGQQLQLDCGRAVQTNSGVDASLQRILADFGKARTQIKAVAGDAKDVDVSGSARSAQLSLNQTQGDLGAHVYLLDSGAGTRRTLAATLADLQTLASA